MKYNLDKHFNHNLISIKNEVDFLVSNKKFFEAKHLIDKIEKSFLEKTSSIWKVTPNPNEVNPKLETEIAKCRDYYIKLLFRIMEIIKVKEKVKFKMIFYYRDENYLEIIVDGFFNHKDDLDLFIKTQFLKADELLDGRLFLENLNSWIKLFEIGVQEQALNKKIEIFESIKLALNEDVLNQFLTHHNENESQLKLSKKQFLENCYKEIDNISPKNFLYSVPLNNPEIQNRKLSGLDIEFIKKAINNVDPKIEKSHPDNNKYSGRINEKVNRFRLAKMKEILENAGKKNTNEIKNLALFHKIEDHFEFFKGKQTNNKIPLLNNEQYINLINWTYFYYENDCSVPPIIDSLKVKNKDGFWIVFKLLY